VYAGTFTPLGSIGLAVLHLPMPCIGDCADRGRVTIDDLVVAVQQGLGVLPNEACPSVDVDWDGTVTVDELLLAVGNALRGCSL
jgi:hypothetical protein